MAKVSERVETSYCGGSLIQNTGGIEMTVYLLEINNYGDWSIDGIYSTWDLAEKAGKKSCGRLGRLFVLHRADGCYYGIGTIGVR